MKRKSSIFYIVGIFLVIIQLISFAGVAKNGKMPTLSFESPALFIFDLVGLISYCFVGIIGIILMIVGDRVARKQRAARADGVQNAYLPRKETQTPPVYQNQITSDVREAPPSSVTRPTESLPPNSNFLEKFNALDDRGKAAVMNVLEYEYSQMSKK